MPPSIKAATLATFRAKGEAQLIVVLIVLVIPIVAKYLLRLQNLLIASSLSASATARAQTTMPRHVREKVAWSGSAATHHVEPTFVRPIPGSFVSAMGGA